MTNERKKHHPIRRAKTKPAPRPEGQRKYGAAKTPEEVVVEAPRRERRALSHVGGEVQFQGGTEEERQVLLHALDVSADEGQVMEDIHGFHSYPARLHPQTARRLVEGFSKEGARVLDPFCGSGTVVLEARALGREAIGNDLNPLAVELAWLKSRGPTERHIREMVHAAKRIAEVAEERRVNKADPYRRYDDDFKERYPIHILLELDSIGHGIELLQGNEVRRMLRLVVSSMLTKLAHSEGDTTRRKAPRRLPAGFAIQLFHQKTEELAQRLTDYRRRLPAKAKRAYVGMADARELENVPSDSVHLIVTSPPYPGVYDYLDHHLHRIEWLGFRAARLSEGEIGARRRYRRLRLDEAAEQWRREIGPILYELRRTLTDDGRGVIIIADSVVDRRALRGDEQIRLVADRAGIDITCIASQERPLFLHGADVAFRNAPRLEHVVVFRPAHQDKRKAERKLKKAQDRPEERVRPTRYRKFDERRMLEEDRERQKERRRGQEDDAPRGPSFRNSSEDKKLSARKPRPDGPRGKGPPGKGPPRHKGPPGKGPPGRRSTKKKFR